MTTPPDWPAADRAYQQHRAACPQCRAAGTSPNTQQRCPEGAQLWGTYQQAGDPAGQFIAQAEARAMRRPISALKFSGLAQAL